MTAPATRITLAAIVISALILTGCGGNSQSNSNTTQVTFGGRNQDLHNNQLLRSPLQNIKSSNDSTAVITGGILVYFQGINGTVFDGAYYLANENSTATASIPNGTYGVIAIGYAGTPLTGTVYCGYGNYNGVANAVSLQGVPTTINIDMMNINDTNSHCADSVFGLQLNSAQICSPGQQTTDTQGCTWPSTAGLQSLNYTNATALGINLATYIGDPVAGGIPSQNIAIPNTSDGGIGIAACFPLIAYPSPGLGEGKVIATSSNTVAQFQYPTAPANTINYVPGATNNFQFLTRVAVIPTPCPSPLTDTTFPTPIASFQTLNIINLTPAPSPTLPGTYSTAATPTPSPTQFYNSKPLVDTAASPTPYPNQLVITL